ncbi:MAG: hypothetical protein JW703_00800 [Candidatus Diapherotrites archaeon]|nr:hypothetical protein [Candidatus Diapherotrites archaeon]
MDLSDLRNQMIHSVKKGIKEEYTESDLHIIKSINLVDAMDETVNLLTEHLREWHAIHFPELNQLVNDNEKFIKLVAELNERKNFSFEKIMKVIEDISLAEKIALKAENSAGEETDKNALNEMRSLAENINALKNQRKQIQEFIEKEMSRKWPNYSKECGSIIGARILAKLGSGKKLAFSPSSTIQVVGAEKALFNYLKKGGLPPKYGYLFAHPLVQQAKKTDKGKTARKLAGKISIAAKKDYFSEDKPKSKIIQIPEMREHSFFKKEFKERKPEFKEKDSFGKGFRDKGRRDFGNRGFKKDFGSRSRDSDNRGFGRDSGNRGFGRDSGNSDFKRKSFGDSDRKPRFGNSDRPRFGDRKSFGDRDNSRSFDRKPRFGNSDRPRFGDRKSFGDSDRPRFSDRKPRFGDRDSDRKPRFNDRSPRGDFDKKPRFGDFDRKPRFNDRDSERTPRFSDRKSFSDSDKPRFGDRKSFRDSDRSSFRGSSSNSKFKRKSSSRKPKPNKTKFKFKKN